MFYFGIDWSQEHHNLCICNEAGASISRLQFEHSVRGFQRLEAEQHKLGVPTRDCLVAIETMHNLLVDFLLDRGYPLYIIPPQATHAYRNRQRSSGAHDDDSDAALLAGILRTDRASHRALRPNSELTQHLAGQVRLIETLRRSIQSQTNRLQAVLLRVYPSALHWFSKLTVQAALQFLIAYPTAQEAQRLSQAEFSAFCQAHDYTHSDLIARRYAQLQQPMPSAAPGIVSASREHVRILADSMLVQVRHRQRLLSQLKPLFAQHPDAPLFASLPGGGDLLAPGLLVKFGDDRQRFPSAAAGQALAGTCPVTQRSGKRQLIRFRTGCDKEFRRIAHQFARASLAKCGWAAAYWQDIRPHCASDAHAYRILANRWLAIVWKLWQTGQPYDESYHLQQRAAHRQPRT